MVYEPMIATLSDSSSNDPLANDFASWPGIQDRGIALTGHVGTSSVGTSIFSRAGWPDQITGQARTAFSLRTEYRAGGNLPH